MVRLYRVDARRGGRFGLARRASSRTCRESCKENFRMLSHRRGVGGHDSAAGRRRRISLVFVARASCPRRSRPHYRLVRHEHRHHGRTRLPSAPGKESASYRPVARGDSRARYGRQNRALEHRLRRTFRICPRGGDRRQIRRAFEIGVSDRQVGGRGVVERDRLLERRIASSGQGRLARVGR